MTENEVLSKLETFKGAIIKIKSDKDELLENYKSMIEQRDEMVERFNSLSDEHSALQENYSTLSHNYEELKKTNQTNLDNLNQEKEQTTSLETKETQLRATYEDKLTEKDEEIKSLKTQLLNDVSAQKAAFLTLKGEYDDFKVEAAKEIESLKEQLAKAKQSNSITEVPAANLKDVQEYRFGRTTEKVKDRFVAFVKALYRGAKKDSEGFYLLADVDSAAKSAEIVEKDKEIIITRLLQMVYGIPPQKLMFYEGEQLKSKLDKDSFIEYITTIN